ncbi:helicase domain protein [Nitzschia inconspicua]|uniref:Helicase domain protein n=1 Tax=Nitzschia inconspicua TaxID=303405 RepID=A0A9K3LPU1_9STRA|nr:helicase domain protein [Nitzschia inconspicua]
MNFSPFRNTHSNGGHPAPRRDLQSLLSLLDRAEQITALDSCKFMARTMDYDNLNTITFLEPTPIRPDHERAMRRQHLSMNNNQQQQMPQHLNNKTTHPPLCPSTESSFSDLFLNSGPLDPRDDDILATIAGNLSNECSVTFEVESFNISLLFGEKSWCANTNDGLTTASNIQLRTYHTSQWGGRFQELLFFYQKHGHLLVPHSYPPNQKLAQWVKRQRHQYKRKQLGHRSTLTEERERQLLEVGFIFDSHRAAWHSRFETLKAFHVANGHCTIQPTLLEDGPSLSVWIKHQRRQYVLLMNGEKSTMTEERITALNSIGFNWNPRQLYRGNKV